MMKSECLKELPKELRHIVTKGKEKAENVCKQFERRVLEVVEWVLEKKLEELKGMLERLRRKNEEIGENKKVKLKIAVITTKIREKCKTRMNKINKLHENFVKLFISHPSSPSPSPTPTPSPSLSPPITPFKPILNYFPPTPSKKKKKTIALYPPRAPKIIFLEDLRKESHQSVREILERWEKAEKDVREEYGRRAEEELGNYLKKLEESF